MSGPVDLRRIPQFVGDLLEELAQEEDAERARHEGMVRAGQLLIHGMGPMRPATDGDELGTQVTASGSMSVEEQQGKKKRLAGKFHAGEGVGGQGAEDQFADHGDQRDLDAVHEVERKAGVAASLLIVAPLGRTQQPGAAVASVRFMSETLTV